ncbi:hypothetical protein J7F01_27775, partial [Streptomyces sp. ISL-22]
ARLQRDTPRADGDTADGTPSSTSEVPDEPVPVVLGVPDGGAREESHSADAAAFSPKSSTPSADRS